ncbi:MAG: glycosyltransferase [Candidatus Jordarchaeales archaeon]
MRGKLVEALRRFLHQNRVDVLWLRYPAAYATELWSICRAQGVPCFYEIVVDTMLHFKTSNKLSLTVKWLSMALAWWHEREMRHIATLTPTVAVAKSLAQKFGDGKVRWLPASTVKETEFYYRDDTCIKPPYKVLYVGGLRPEKSVETLIEATSILLSRSYSVELHIVGDGDQREELQLLAGRLLPASSCYFHGFRSEPAEIDQFYCEADIFALSSLTEGFPRVILEAMARGLPVVATDIVGIPDLVKHRQTGMLVPVRTPLRLAEAIAELIENAVLRKQVIAEGYTVAREYTLERFLLRLVDFIREEVGVDLLSEA